MYNVQINNIEGTWEFISYWYCSKGTSCNACGHTINNVYVIQNEEGKQINVGGECLINILGQREGTKLSKAIKSIESKIKTQFMKPLKFKQLEKNIQDIRQYLTNYEINKLRDSIRFQEEICSWSPDTFQKIIRANGGQYKFDSPTKEEKEELKEIQTKAINEYIINKKEITSIKTLKELIKMEQ